MNTKRTAATKSETVIKSSELDRTITEHAADIRKVNPCPVR
jgi:hypothetical protein